MTQRVKESVQKMGQLQRGNKGNNSNQILCLNTFPMSLHAFQFWSTLLLACATTSQVDFQHGTTRAGLCSIYAESYTVNGDKEMQRRLAKLKLKGADCWLEYKMSWVLHIDVLGISATGEILE